MNLVGFAGTARLLRSKNHLKSSLVFGSAGTSPIQIRIHQQLTCWGGHNRTRIAPDRSNRILIRQRIPVFWRIPDNVHVYFY